MEQNLVRNGQSPKAVSEHGDLKLIFKRGIDLVGSVIGVVLFSPVLLLVAVLVIWDSPGPALYKISAFGIHGRRFTLYKIRSMVNNALDLLSQRPELMEEYRRSLKLANDPRITRIGRILRMTSLDELPQLFNVLRGDMSLVGPRCLSDIELERYGANGAKVLSVKPAMTGLWQVSGRQTVSFERRMELDLYYVDHWNLWMDAVILLKTLPAVFSGKGAR